MTETGRFSPAQWHLAQERAVGFRDQLVQWTTHNEETIVYNLGRDRCGRLQLQRVHNGVQLN